jgi:hypothetical protein
MEKFPTDFVPSNLSEFKVFNKERQLYYLRRHIYESMLSVDFSIPDKCFVDLQKIDIGQVGEIYYKIDPEIIMTVQKELEALGWCTSTAYGGTILFIYTADRIPSEIVNAKLFD